MYSKKLMLNLNKNIKHNEKTVINEPNIGWKISLKEK